jgi:glucose-1-phosphate adenylyltransferase
MIPAVIDDHRVFAYPFVDENGKPDAYWRDVGTLDAYYEANMDLASVDPLLNLYDQRWPIRTHLPNYPPPKFVFAEEGEHARRGQALDSILCLGAIVSGGQVERSVLLNVGEQLGRRRDSILMDHVDIGRHARIRRAIIDGVISARRHDRLRQRRTPRGFTVSEGGVVVVAKGFGEEPLPSEAEVVASHRA